MPLYSLPGGLSGLETRFLEGDKTSRFRCLGGLSVPFSPLDVAVICESDDCPREEKCEIFGGEWLLNTNACASGKITGQT